MTEQPTVTWKEHVDALFAAERRAVEVALENVREKQQGSRADRADQRAALSLSISIVALGVAVVSLFLRVR